MYSAHQQLSFFIALLFLISVPAILIAGEEGVHNKTYNRVQKITQKSAERSDSGVARNEMQRWKLIVFSRRLERDLANLDLPDKWQLFLRLPSDISILKKAGNENGGQQTLQLSLKRFALVACDDQYHQIASLSSFQATHRALKAYASSHKESIGLSEDKSRTELRLSQAKNLSDLENRPAQISSIYRLPPVLISSEQPDLLATPAQ